MLTVTLQERSSKDLLMGSATLPAVAVPDTAHRCQGLLPLETPDPPFKRAQAEANQARAASQSLIEHGRDTYWYPVSYENL